MNDFGGTADDLKTAIDAVMEEYGVSDRYLRRLVSVCCDGASINMGKYNGVASETCTSLAADNSLRQS